MEEVIPVLNDPSFAGLVVSLGIQQEIGSIHDQLADYIFDPDTQILVPRSVLRAELVKLRDKVGVKIWAEGFSALDIRIAGFRSLLHPDYSFNPNGSIRECVIFPESVAKIAALEGTEVVLVRPWGLNTIFGGFDVSKPYYETNMWELANYDTRRYAKLLKNRQVAFLGTHDLVSHIAGLKKAAWSELQLRGEKSFDLLEAFSLESKKLQPYALVLPYLLGVIMDDLAQPANYESWSRKYIFDLIFNSIQRRDIGSRESRLLFHFPPAYEELIDLARSEDIRAVEERAPAVFGQLIKELRQFSVLSTN